MTRQTVHPPPHDRAASPAFTATERRLIRRLSSPALVQRYLNSLPYNTEPPPGGPTLRSFRSVDRLRARYFAFKRAFSGQKPVNDPDREHWTELPREFLR